jgi:hypothetical protein
MNLFTKKACTDIRKSLLELFRNVCPCIYEIIKHFHYAVG